MRKITWQAAPLRRHQPEPRASTDNVIPLRPVTRAPKVDPIDQADDHPDTRRRERERERCKAILTCPAASALPAVARALAFETTLSRQEAMAMLQRPVFAAAERQRGA